MSVANVCGVKLVYVVIKKKLLNSLFILVAITC